MEDEMVK